MRELTDREQLFVEYYCTESNGSARDAARRAGYSDGGIANASKMLKKEPIQHYIEEWRADRKHHFRISENKILERMWEEANFSGEGATHAGRINALLHLGKHLGMFEKKPQKEEKRGHTYNIINYSTADPMADRISKAVKQKEKEVIEALEHSEEVEVKDYSKEADDA